MHQVLSTKTFHTTTLIDSHLLYWNIFNDIHCSNIHSFTESEQHWHWVQEKQKSTRRMYWRRASIQDGQAPGDATVLKQVFRENNSIFWIGEFFYMCLYAIFSFSDGHVTTFRHPSWGLYRPNTWSQTLQTSKRHTFGVSAFHRYHWFGVKLFPVGCAQIVKGNPKNAKNAVFLDLAPPTL